jgi:hypothetical protein
MTIAEMVYIKVKQLPEPLARQVLDFVVSLREGRDLIQAPSNALNAVWDNSQDEVWYHVCLVHQLVFQRTGHSK